MPRLSEEAKEERRERVLAGARRCFATHGYEGATVARLEEEIGLSRGAIFNWFPSKADLFLELAARDNDRVSRIWIEHGLEATIRALLDEDPEWLGVYLGFAHRLRTDTTFRQRWKDRAPQELEQQIIGQMRSQQAAGELRSDLDPEQIGRFLGVVFDGLVMQRAAGFEPPTDVVLGLVRDALGPATGRGGSQDAALATARESGLRRGPIPAPSVGSDRKV
jgi:TetR/AcrR family transcriptional regulator, transcriptional repressor of aconitase